MKGRPLSGRGLSGRKLGGYGISTRGRGGGGASDFVPPPSIQLSGLSIAEDAEVGDLIGELSVANSPEGVTWTFATDTGTDAEVDLDAVDTSLVEVAGALDFETQPSLTLVVIATPDVGDPIGPRTFNISVTDVFEPTGDSLLEFSTGGISFLHLGMI